MFPHRFHGVELVKNNKLTPYYNFAKERIENGLEYVQLDRVRCYKLIHEYWDKKYPNVSIYAVQYKDCGTILVTKIDGDIYGVIAPIQKAHLSKKKECNHHLYGETFIHALVDLNIGTIITTKNKSIIAEEVFKRSYRRMVFNNTLEKEKKNYPKMFVKYRWDTLIKELENEITA